MFHIEPDELTKQIKNTKQGPSQPKKISSQKVSDQFARHLSEQVRTYIPLVDFSKKFPRYHNGGPVKVQITISPRGDLLQRKLVKGSGDTDWDVVVLQALDKLSIMPNYPETLPSEFTVTLFDDGNEQVEEDATPESIAQINKLTRKR